MTLHRTVCYFGNATSPLMHRWLNHALERDMSVHLITVDKPDVSIASEVLVHVIGDNGRPDGGRPIGYVRGSTQVRRIISEITPDLTHVHYAWGYGLLAAISKVSPLIVSIWGSDLLVSAQASWFHRQAMRAVLSRADAICATSKFLVTEAGRYTTKPVHHTPFGVDCDEFRPATGAQRNPPIRVGMVKLLSPGSGIGQLLEAFARIHVSHPGRQRLVVAGAPTTGTDWPGQARSLGIEEVVDFLGEIPEHDVPSVMRSMDVFVAPATHREGFGVAVLEAQACGLPVIASSIGGLPEVLQRNETGVLVPPGDVIQLQAALESMISDSSERARMAKAAREFVVEHYSWESTTRIMDEVYARALR